MVMRAALAIAALAFFATSCAAVWGFESLSLGPDGGEDASGGDASADGSTQSGSDGAIDGAISDVSSGDGGGGGLSCENTNGTCRCTAMPPANGVACSPAALGVDAAAVICCADPGYPQNGSCMCQWIGCTTSNGVCLCGPGNGTPGGSCAASGWTCCLQTGAPECLCAATSCQVGFTPFGNACAISDIKCPGAQRAVASCN
jgi:hypothetical protein